jgi:antitoxin component YwqK of YwqJK toxin-antitoxin module
MKKIVISALAFVLSFSVFAQGMPEFVPSGRISSYTKTTYSVTSKFGDYFRSVSEKETHALKGGVETDVSFYNSKDEITKKISTSFGTAKRISARDFSDMTSGATLHTEFEYGDDGNLKTETVTDAASGSLGAKTIYKYEDGKTVKNLYDKDGKLLERTIFTLNDDGKTTEEVVYFGDGFLNVSRKFIYNDDGKISIVETFDGNSVSVSKLVFRYDSSKFLTEVQHYSGDGKLRERHIYKNDALGNPTRISYYNVAEKFGTTVNELVLIEDFSYTTN